MEKKFYTISGALEIVKQLKWKLECTFLGYDLGLEFIPESFFLLVNLFSKIVKSPSARILTYLEFSPFLLIIVVDE
jgi:hypothetical protein